MLKLLLWMTLGVALGSCGGGDRAAVSAPSPAGAVAALPQRADLVAAPSPYGQATPADAAEQLMNFGEARFSQYFPSHQATALFQPFRYRFYPQTGIYLGVAINVVPGAGLVEGGVYVMGGPFGGAPAFQGIVSDIIIPNPTPPRPTSYAAAKNQGLSRIRFPASLSQFVPDQPLAWGAGDFFHNGTIDIFSAKQNYFSNTPFATVSSDPKFLSDFQFWRQQSDGTLSLLATYKGCIHPRKAAVADFNQDGWPDVFVACHGYDAQVNGRLPGEKSKLLLSDGVGGFTMSDATPVGFYHGASAADVDGDGYPDLVLANIHHAGGLNVYFLMNQKDGTFREDNTRVPGLTGQPFFSVELLDVDGDGLLDLIVGGHESESGTSSNAQTAVLYGDLNGVFGATKTVIPPVAGRGVVLDFTLVSNNGQKVLYVDRAADGSDPAFPFYSTRTLQAVNLTTGLAPVLLDQRGRWVPWWLPATRNGQNGVAPYNISLPDFFFSQ